MAVCKRRGSRGSSVCPRRTWLAHRMRLPPDYLPTFLFLTLTSWIFFPFTAAAQNPYRVAGDHYRLILENQWVRATRVTYAPGETSPIHDHPRAGGVIYVYLTDAGVMRFRHFNGDTPSHVADRPPVSAGSVRLSVRRRGVPFR